MKKAKLPLPGFRTIKTAIAILACLLLYSVIGRENVLLALFATILSMHDSIRRSVNDGINRIIGAVIGGAFGICVVLLAGGLRDSAFLWYVIVSVGVIVLICFFNVIKRKNSIAIGSIVFLIIMLDTSLKSPFMYATDYVVDTVIGICIALFVNQLPLGNLNDRGMLKAVFEKQVKLNYKIYSSKNRNVTKWSGGESTELLIFPADAQFEDRSFDWRIAAAKTSATEFEFSNLGGFMRHIMILDGNVTMVHDGHHTISLKPFEQDYFDGAWKSKGFGACRDMNLILSEDYEGKLIACENNVSCFLKDITQNHFLNSHCVVYCPSGQISIAAFCDEKLIMKIDLDEGELILFENLDSAGGVLKFIPYAEKTDFQKAVCIAAYIAKKQAPKPLNPKLIKE
ncbi:MAG: HutD family protein [Oscillospiraceae bacterium]|nr:HutD family protein [Oscillospiraceae bacterium]